MFQAAHKSKIKNEKIMRWRLELSNYKFDIVYRCGKDNYAADALSRADLKQPMTNVVSSCTGDAKLKKLHEDLCHPGITRLLHWIRSKNLPYSTEEVKRVVTTCSTCAELKPQFIKKDGQLIKALRPFERLNIDFKGPLPQTQSGKRYILTVVDEFSRFPFAFPCADMNASTVCNHLNDLFSVFGTPAYIHSDQGTTFMSTELKSFLQDRGIATSRTTPYNPQGNGQCERYNGVIWKAVQLALRTHGLTKNQWEIVLQDALHSVRSLLCTATNATPHERMFLHPRRSSNGYSIPSWLSSGNKAYMKRHVRASKFDPYVDEVELLEVNPDYAHVRLADGREATVSVKHLAPTGNPTEPIPNSTTQPETEDTSVSQNQINSSPRHH
ncbi:unnamed protein product, partial [Nesidiocoris tenuis]